MVATLWVVVHGLKPVLLAWGVIARRQGLCGFSSNSATRLILTRWAYVKASIEQLFGSVPLSQGTSPTFFRAKRRPRWEPDGVSTGPLIGGTDEGSSERDGRGEESQTCSGSTGDQLTPRRSAADQAAIQFPRQAVDENGTGPILENGTGGRKRDGWTKTGRVDENGTGYC